MANYPLAGLKILVTRPHDQALQLAQDIERAGGIPLLFPLLDIAPVQDFTRLQQQVSRLSQANLTIFISPNAVQYGMAAIRAAGVCFDTGGLKIAAIGMNSAKALQAWGVSDVLVPVGRFDSESLLARPELQHINGWRVMIFRGDGGRELLGDTLAARGAAVEYVTCYLRRKPQLNVRELLGAQPDLITVTSSEALSHLSQALDAPDSSCPGGALRDKPIFVPHPRIAELAHRQGWTQVHLTDAGDEGLLSALQAWAKQKGIE